MESPTPLNPLGVKGAAESGTIAAPAVIVSAIEDALQPFGVRITRPAAHAGAAARADPGSRLSARGNGPMLVLILHGGRDCWLHSLFRIVRIPCSIAVASSKAVSPPPVR